MLSRRVSGRLIGAALVVGAFGAPLAAGAMQSGVALADGGPCVSIQLTDGGVCGLATVQGLDFGQVTAQLAAQVTQ